MPQGFLSIALYEPQNVSGASGCHRGLGILWFPSDLEETRQLLQGTSTLRLRI